MNVRNLHPWDLTPKEAVAVQKELAGQIDTASPFELKRGDIVAGVDNSYLKSESGTTAFAAVVIMTWPDCEPIEIRTATGAVTFPYVPGLLTFRELPVLIEALSQVENSADLIFCDGHGIAHPRRIGIAAHLGLLLNLPTIGIAKKPLRAKWDDPVPGVGSTSPLFVGTDHVGFAVRTSTRRKHPVFVSPGHRIRLEDVVAPMLAASDGAFLPKPQQATHDAVTKLREEVKRNHKR